MKKIFIFPLLICILVACRKTDKVAKNDYAYECHCTTRTYYIDHCGQDSGMQSLNVYGSDRNEASKACDSNEWDATDSYSITNRSCDLK